MGKRDHPQCGKKVTGRLEKWLLNCRTNRPALQDLLSKTFRKRLTCSLVGHTHLALRQSEWITVERNHTPSPNTDTQGVIANDEISVFPLGSIACLPRGDTGAKKIAAQRCAWRHRWIEIPFAYCLLNETDVLTPWAAERPSGLMSQNKFCFGCCDVLHSSEVCRNRLPVAVQSVFAYPPHRRWHAKTLSFFETKTIVSRCAPGSQGALRGPIGEGVLVEVVRALTRARMQVVDSKDSIRLPPCHLHEASQIGRSKSQGRSPGLGS